MWYCRRESTYVPEEVEGVKDSSSLVKASELGGKAEVRNRGVFIGSQGPSGVNNALSSSPKKETCGLPKSSSAQQRKTRCTAFVAMVRVDSKCRSPPDSLGLEEIQVVRRCREWTSAGMLGHSWWYNRDPSPTLSVRDGEGFFRTRVER